MAGKHLKAAKHVDQMREAIRAIDAHAKELAAQTDTRYTQALLESARRGGAPVQIAPRP